MIHNVKKAYVKRKIKDMVSKGHQLIDFVEDHSDEISKIILSLEPHQKAAIRKLIKEVKECLQ